MTTVISVALVLLAHVWSAHALTSKFFSEFVIPHVQNNITLEQSVYDFIAELTAATPGVATYTQHNITFDYT